MTMNHTHLADLLDRAHAATVDLDRALSLAGLTSWPIDSPRRYSLAALEHLAGTRETLDRITVAAGFASPYVRRDLKPNARTRAAAREAQPWPYSRDEHTNLERVHRVKSRGFPGPGNEGTRTRDEDTEAQLDKGAPTGGSSSVLSAHALPTFSDDHDHAEIADALSEPLGAS